MRAKSIIYENKNDSNHSNLVFPWKLMAKFNSRPQGNSQISILFNYCGTTLKIKLKNLGLIQRVEYSRCIYLQTGVKDSNRMNTQLFKETAL